MGDRPRQRNMRKAAPDPRKDKLAYFKDNIQTQDEEEFDPAIYYYRRPGAEKEHVGSGAHPAAAAHMSRVAGDSRMQGDQHRYPAGYSPRIYGGHSGMVHPGVATHPGLQPAMNSRNVHSLPSSMGTLGRYSSGTVGGRGVGASAPAPSPGVRLAGMHKPMIPGSGGTAAGVQMHPSGYSTLAGNYGSGSMGVHGSASSDGISLHDMKEFPTLNKGASSDGIPVRSRREMGSPKKFMPQDGRAGAAMGSEMAPTTSMGGGFGTGAGPPMNLYIGSAGVPGSYEPVGREGGPAAGRPPPRYAGGPAQPGRPFIGGIPTASSSGAPHTGSGRGAQRGRHLRMPAGATGVGRGGYGMHQRMPKVRATALPDKYGLMGLLSVIRMSDPDLNTLAVGTDLTTLGLNLNAPESLYATFDSPFREGPSKVEPEYYVPACYYIKQAMKPAESKIALFSLETLFYVFYSMPGDAAQLAAAKELEKKEWHFHKSLQMWFKPNKGSRMERFSKPDGAYERGTYTFFDPTLWEQVTRENFTLKVDW